MIAEELSRLARILPEGDHLTFLSFSQWILKNFREIVFIVDLNMLELRGRLGVVRNCDHTVWKFGIGDKLFASLYSLGVWHLLKILVLLVN